MNIRKKTHQKSQKARDGATTPSPTQDARLKAVMDNYEELREFYQGETSRYAFWFHCLQVVTLVGAAGTPLLLLLDIPKQSVGTIKLIQALPSAIGGVAAGINAAFRFRQEWAQNYVTLSALMNEYQRFTVRVSPDYSHGEVEAIDTFQNRVSAISMDEVKSWETAALSADKRPEQKP